MASSKIVLVLAFAVFGVVQAKSLPASSSASRRCLDADVVAAIATANASIHAASARASTAVNAALAHINIASANLSATASTATNLQASITPPINGAILGFLSVANTGLALAGATGAAVAACLNLQYAAITGTPGQAVSDLNSCLTDVQDQVNAYYTDVVEKQSAVDNLVPAADAAIAVCTPTTAPCKHGKFKHKDSGEDVVTDCINDVVTATNNRADAIAQEVGADSEAVDVVMQNLREDLMKCAVSKMYGVLNGAGNIATALATCVSSGLAG